MTHEKMRENIKNKVYEGGGTERDFYEDLTVLFGVKPGDDLTKRMYAYAWEKGHSAGYMEVYSYFHDLVEVYKGE